jgi:Sortase domain
LIKRVLAAVIVLVFAVGTAAMVAPLFFLQPDRQSAATPTRVRIPAIGVDAPVEPVSAAGTGALDLPRDAGRIGWYAPGVRPGQPGDAVLAGQVDATDRAALRRLAEVRAGSQIQVLLSDGTTLTFDVASAEGYPGNRQPPDLFARGGTRRLSLIAAGTPAPGASRPARIVVEATLQPVR